VARYVVVKGSAVASGQCVERWGLGVGGVRGMWVAWR
jgi:hypothetical protein